MSGLRRLCAGDFGLTAEQAEAIERHIDENERDPRFAARERIRQQEREDEDAANLDSMTDKALDGTYGPLAKKTAAEHVNQHGRSRWAMEKLRLKLQRVPGRLSG